MTVTEKYYQEHLDEDKRKVAKALNGVLVKAAGGDLPNEFGGKFGGKKDDTSPPVPQCPAKPAGTILTLIKTVG